MKFKNLNNCVMAAALAVLPLGCSREKDDRAHARETAENDAPKVCGYKEGHGVFVSKETSEAIGLRVADVVTKVGTTAVPESSLLSTATGDFVFTLSGEHFQRTAIKTAGPSNGWVTVSEGLLEGDQVVTNGMRELWRIELQNTKGGYACCAVEKKK